MRNLLVALLIALGGLAQGAPEPARGISDWKAELGNHRARVLVVGNAEAVRVHLLWRRRDEAPEAKNILIVDAATGKAIRNVARIRIDRLDGDLAFQPESGVGQYFVYYMPFETTGSPYFPVVTYPKPKNDADPAWLEGLAGDRWKQLPEAKVVDFQDRGEFHRYTSMELIAGQAETQHLLAVHPTKDFLLFPEDRDNPIRMTSDLPERWILRGPNSSFAGEARRGEFYSFQVGVWAARKPLHHVTVKFGRLADKAGHLLPHATLRCFNLGGTDWLGRTFSKQVDVIKDQVAPLWMGAQIPKDARPGVYRGVVSVGADGSAAQTISIQLVIRPEVAQDSGDNDPFKMTRLRWLDSKIGLDDEVVAPYTPLKVSANTVSCLGRTVQFGKDGLPISIQSGGREILSAPISLDVKVGDNPLKWSTPQVPTRTLKSAPGAITQQTDLAAQGLLLTCVSKMEADGYINFKLALTARHAIDPSDIDLKIPVRRDIATYLMGMGRKGGYRPAKWSWNWNDHYANNMVWLGGVEAGLQCKLKDATESWELFRLPNIPDAWGNGGRGGCEISESGADTVMLRAFCGPRKMAAGQTLHFNFGLLITPVKPLDPAHWTWRYDHEFVPPEQAVKNGATIVNIHQGNDLNPNINYPFLAAPKLATYVKSAHGKGLKVKIYYTVRELSNRVAEMWPLRSLGTEIFTDGPGGGDSWLQEHLDSHYKPAWHTPLPDGSVDAAIATTGLSRWHNYYLEGLRWLIQNVGIDGLYLDGIGYDREIMKRVRKVMDRTKPGCLIDFHSGNSFAPQYGMNSPANLYMEHLPYISSLWFGEGYDYNETPDYWLVEISGIPFGLYGEMLEGNGNPWRGMVYGMTARYYSGADPKHIWKLWDDFGIAKAKMLGYWSPACPVRTDNPSVLATAYVKNGKTLVALASWAKGPVQCRIQLDWRALGLDPSRATLTAPAVEGFQSAARFGVDDEISVDPGKGWMIVVGQR